MQEYVHRVGRTARGVNKTGNAVILLRPEEEDFIEILKMEKVYLDKYNLGEPSLELQEQVSKHQLTTPYYIVSTIIIFLSDLYLLYLLENASYLLFQFEEMIENDGVMKILARKAFLTFLRCYQKHPMKEIFNIRTLDLKATAKAFGFTKQPDVDFL